MATSCPTFSTFPLLPAYSPTWPPTRKVVVVKTTASVEEIAKEDEEQVVGRLSNDIYNQDF